MEVESKYVVRRTGAFSEILAAEALGQYRLEPLDSTPVRDAYVDTEASDLLNQGYVLRIREQGGIIQATLKSMGGVEGPVHRRIEIEIDLEKSLDDEGHLDLPEGLLRDTLDELIEDRPLAPCLQLRQYRSPRILFEGPRLVGVLTLDVIAVETEVGPEVSHQIEVELSEDGEEADLYQLDPILKERGMEPTSSSKFERGLILLQRNPARPLALLPHEQVILRRYQEEGTPLFRRRARVILLSARGMHPSSVATKVGLSLNRVEHWIDAYRRRRTAIFDDATVDVLAARAESKTHQFSISELVSAGPPVPALFPADLVAGSSREAHVRSFEYDTSAEPGPIATAHTTEARRGRRADAQEIVRDEQIEEKARVPGEVNAEASDGSIGDGGGVTAPYLRSHSKSGDAKAVPVSDVAETTTIDVEEAGEVTHAISDEQDEALAEIADSPALPVHDIAIPPKPTLKSTDSVLSAAERVLRYQFAWQADAANRVNDSSGEPPSIRRLLVGAHRLRIALQLFEDYLPPRPVNRLHKGLRALTRSVDLVGDFDHVIEHIKSAQSDASASEASGFAQVLTSLNSERNAAWDALHVRLNSAARGQWSRRFETLLARLKEQVAQGVQANEFTPNEPESYLEGFADLPPRTRLRDMLGSAVWRRYEGLRAVDTMDGALTDELLHPLGVACASMQYVLALTGSCAAQSVRGISGPMVEMESHLAVLHHARLTTDALTPFADTVGVAELHDRLQSLQKDMLKEALGLWKTFVAPAYGQSLARVVASL